MGGIDLREFAGDYTPDEALEVVKRIQQKIDSFKEPETISPTKKNIIDTISDLCSDFLYYDRKEDELLSVEQLNAAVEHGIITIDEMVAEFRKHLENTYNAIKQ